MPNVNVIIAVVPLVMQTQIDVSNKPVLDVGISTSVKEQLHGLQMAILGTAKCDYLAFSDFLWGV